MAALEEYFEDYHDYLFFIEAIAAQFDDKGFDGKRKIGKVEDFRKVDGGTGIRLPFKGLPEEGYCIQVSKMEATAY